MSWSGAERPSPERVPTPGRWLAGVHDAVERQPHLPLLIVALFTVAYFAATCELASLKPFSLDELDVFKMAQQPTATDVMRAWFASGDGMPPLVHLATHLAGSTLGFSHVTGRLPAIVGFWLMCVCVFTFLRRRVGLALATIGLLLPLTAPAVYAYAYEARGYGLVLGFSGAALVCWDLAHGRRWRWLALVALPICLVAAIMSHFYAVLVIAPLTIGELARTIERRRVDWLVWIACLAPALILSSNHPVVAHVRGLREIALHAHRVSVSELVDVWSQFLSIPITYLGLLAIMCLVPGRWSMVDGSTIPDSRERRPSTVDWVLAVACMALPVGMWLLANLVNGNFIFRYAIITIAGFGLGVPLFCYMGIRHRPEVALLLAGWVAVTAAGSTLASRHTLRTTTLTTEHIAAGRGCARLLTLWDRLPANELPIVVVDFNVFHQLHHYGAEGLRKRLVFVVDHEFGQLIEPEMPFYARVFGERMAGLEEFLAANPDFYLYDCGAPARQPLVERLLGAGASLRESGMADTPEIGPRRDLYRVSLSGGSMQRDMGR